VFDDRLTRVQQLEVAREVVETRAPELARAYPGVVDISFGYRRRRPSPRGAYEVVPLPSVRFIVRHKWPRGAARSRKGAIPERLFAYCSLDGRRQLCAVPTDVEDARAFVGTRPQAGNIRVRWDGSNIDGTLTCALRRQDDMGMFALSCRHVLSLSDARHPEPTWGAAVELRADGAKVGVTRAIAGPLRRMPDRSFDAQLMAVENADAIRRALAGLHLNGYAAGFEDIPDHYFIRTPRATIPAQKVGFVYDRPIYRMGGVGYVAHYLLVESAPDHLTIGGDSGSPVVSEVDGGVLLGMHIAAVNNGPGNRFAYMIPAWQLLDPANFDGTSNTEGWVLHNP
jgi:hypothetical protein